MDNFIYLFFYMYFSGLLMIFLKCKHLLLMLLSLEFVVLSLYYGLFCIYYYFDFEYYFSLIFLTFSVCEGALGLSVLVSMIRCYGNDYFYVLNVLW